MTFFAIVEERDRLLEVWTGLNPRLGGYVHLSQAVRAILRHSTNGRIQDDSRKPLVLLQSDRITFVRRAEDFSTLQHYFSSRVGPWTISPNGTPWISG